MRLKPLILALMLASGPALAQAEQPVMVPAATVRSLALYLHFGGTRAEADGLFGQLDEAMAAPQRAAAEKKRVDDAVAAALAQRDAKPDAPKAP